MYILHLSDLHFGSKKNAEDWYEQLARDLNSNDLKCNSLDALVLSGDIATNCTSEEYEAAREFIINLMIRFRLDWSEVVIVPGNHDFDQKRAKKAYKNTDSDDYDGPRDENHIFEGENKDDFRVLDPAIYKQRFSNFSEFYTAVVKERYPLEPEWQFTLQHFPNHNLLILGLNSAWHLDPYYTSRGASINRNALNRAMARINENPSYQNSRLKIAVWHHPLNISCKNHIEERGFMEQLAQNGFRLVLHGHLDQGGSNKYRDNTYSDQYGNQIDIIAAGTFGVSEERWKLKHPSQYNLLKWEGKKLTVYTRKRIQLGGAWRFDAMWGKPDGITASSFYEIELFSKDERSRNISHYPEISKAITEGSIVPFLGPDINLCDRPSEKKDSKPYEWVYNGEFPPTNLELAAYIDKQTSSNDREQCGYLDTVRCPLLQGTSLDELPQRFPPECPLSTKHITSLNLQRVSQYITSRSRDYQEKLRQSINDIYNQSSYKSNSLHIFLVSLIKEVSVKDHNKPGVTPYPLIVTTCFDRTLESTFEKESLPFDLVSYTSSKQKFIYQKFDLKDKDGGKEITCTNEEIISDENENKDLTFLKERPVILRLYGPVKWNDAQKRENFAITEDHFLDYLACDIFSQLPTDLLLKLQEGHLWFLGYSLSYWNLRFIIRQIRQSVKPNIIQWWAVQEKADILDRYLWVDNDVTFFSTQEIGSLEQYLEKVAKETGFSEKYLKEVKDRLYE